MVSIEEFFRGRPQARHGLQRLPQVGQRRDIVGKRDAEEGFLFQDVLRLGLCSALGADDRNAGRWGKENHLQITMHPFLTYHRFNSTMLSSILPLTVPSLSLQQSFLQKSSYM